MEEKNILTDIGPSRLAQSVFGQTFGRLTVSDYAGYRWNITPKRTQRIVYLNCKCSCGENCVVSLNGLRGGKTKSCGCYNRDVAKVRATRHGLTHTKTHNIWSSMMTRCARTYGHHYKYYGAKGIKVCERWQKFDNFLEDMGLCPDDKHSIDRLDNSKNYELSNCIYSDKYEQANNRSTNSLVDYKDGKYTITMLCRKFSLPYFRLRRVVANFRKFFDLSKDFVVPLDENFVPISYC